MGFVMTVFTAIFIPLVIFMIISIVAYKSHNKDTTSESAYISKKQRLFELANTLQLGGFYGIKIGDKHPNVILKLAQLGIVKVDTDGAVQELRLDEKERFIISTTPNIFGAHEVYFIFDNRTNALLYISTKLSSERSVIVHLQNSLIGLYGQPIKDFRDNTCSVTIWVDKKYKTSYSIMSNQNKEEKHFIIGPYITFPD